MQFQLKKIVFAFIAALFIIVFHSCTKEYSYEAGSSLFAKGTLKDSSGTCLHIAATGVFYNGITPNADSNYAELKIHVTQAGIYNISTDQQNGFRFVDSGQVYNTGDTVIHLKSIGIPVDTGATFFTVRFNNDDCYFFVYVQDSTGTGLGGSKDTISIPVFTDYLWKFIDSTNHLIFRGSLTGKFSTSELTGVLSLYGTGFTASTDTVIYINLDMPDTSLTNIVPGDFVTTGNNSFRFSVTANGIQTTIYNANAFTDEQIMVRLIDYSAGVLTGWFYGAAEDKNGNTTRIEDGSFTVNLN